ncbi:hypothetical protein ACH4C6_23255 [Streptomyces sp. NPDC017943]|uniref:hypothetical protein n=1 Tax=Streptomyces sp. NPDC017943 TaxID=3365019 RepID=UPI003789109A
MSWTRAPRAVLAVCVLVPAGLAGCGSGGDAPERQDSPAPVGRLLDDRDQQGRAYREVEPEGAPDVGVEVQPDAAGAWDVRLSVRNFRFSPAGTAPRAAAGRGLAHLYVDGHLVARLRAPQYRLAADLVPRGTHHVTARLHADDGTVWAVDGKPVESTADITASRPDPGERSPGSEGGKAPQGGIDGPAPPRPAAGRTDPSGSGAGALPGTATGRRGVAARVDRRTAARGATGRPVLPGAAGGHAPQEETGRHTPPPVGGLLAGPSPDGRAAGPACPEEGSPSGDGRLRAGFLVDGRAAAPVCRVGVSSSGGGRFVVASLPEGPASAAVSPAGIPVPGGGWVHPDGA